MKKFILFLAILGLTTPVFAKVYDEVNSSWFYDDEKVTYR
jgi:hypothetical protein